MHCVVASDEEEVRYMVRFEVGFDERAISSDRWQQPKTQGGVLIGLERASLDGGDSGEPIIGIHCFNLVRRTGRLPLGTRSKYLGLGEDGTGWDNSYAGSELVRLLFGIGRQKRQVERCNAAAVLAVKIAALLLGHADTRQGCA